MTCDPFTDHVSAGTSCKVQYVPTLLRVNAQLKLAMVAAAVAFLRVTFRLE